MIGPGDGPAIACPFELCRQTVRLTIEQAEPGDDELTLKRIPLHELGNLTMARGTCPASLMEIPLVPTAMGHLAEVAATMRKMLAESLVTDAINRATSSDRPEHPKTPHPVKGNGWFTQGGSPGPDTSRKDPVARPRLRVIGGSDRPDADAHLPKGDAPMTDNARDRLKALAYLAAEKAELASETAGALVEKLREVEALAEVCGMHIGAADTLARSAVGGGAVIPTTAGVMVTEIAAAHATLTTTRTALAQAKRNGAMITVHASKSSTNARTYAGSF